MRHRLFTILASLALLGSAIHAVPANAGEPQILGLVASNGPLPMTCDDRECSVELSSFCMQERAPVPPPLTPYQLAANSAEAISIVATTATGRTVRLPAVGFAEFVSIRGNRATRMSVPHQELAVLGLTGISVEVGELASLVPDSLMRSDDPTVQSEIVVVTGPLREVANRLIDNGGPGTVAARITNRLINAIPENSGGDVDDRDALWTTVIDDRADPLLGDAGENAEGLDMAREAFGRCASLPGGGFISFRQCLAARHDIFLSPQNRAYWEAVETGS